MTKIIKSVQKVAQIKVSRVKGDDVIIEVIYIEDGQDVDLSSRDIKLLFLEPVRNNVIIEKIPHQIVGSLAVFELTEAEKYKISKNFSEISIKVDGVTRAKGTFTWAAEYDEQASNPKAIGINYVTLEESAEFFEVIVGPHGMTAYEYAVMNGYSGTESQFGQYMANLPIYASDAQQAASNAYMYASQAAGHADDAWQASRAADDAMYEAWLHAGNAQLSATSAQNASNTAQNASNTATTKASEAEESANEASQYRDDALDAKLASEIAASNAEGYAAEALDAKDISVQNKIDAENAASTAVSAAGIATTKASEANDSAGLASSYASSANNAANTAITKASEAGLSESNALSYANAANSHKEDTIYYTNLAALSEYNSQYYMGETLNYRNQASGYATAAQNAANSAIDAAEEVEAIKDSFIRNNTDTFGAKVQAIVSLTQEEYNDIPIKEINTMYIVTEDPVNVITQLVSLTEEEWESLPYEDNQTIYLMI